MREAHLKRLMYKSESSFLQALERKVEEAQKLAKTEIMPDWARGIGDWLVVNPWRVIAPMSAIAYGILRTAYGTSYREFILVLFGGF